MDRKLNLTEDDLFAAILGLDVDEDDPSFLTIREISDRLGLDRQVAERRMKQAVKAGKAEMRHVRRAAEDGRLRTLLVYRPKLEGKQ